ncbi:hypothetical protein [Campylobacter concisus]|nr:hypothetical protein [Campylobacter concisus]
MKSKFNSSFLPLKLNLQPNFLQPPKSHNSFLSRNVPCLLNINLISKDEK